MSDFVDRVMIGLSDPVKLRELVSPAADGTHQRLRLLFATVYRLPFAVVHDVISVEVLDTEFQRPLFSPRRLAGTWTQASPSYTRTDVLYEGLDVRAPEWLDLSAGLALTVVLEVDRGEVETIRLHDLGEFSTLDEFRAAFRFFDLDAFMAQHGITTVAELKRAFRYLLGEIRLKAVPPFDPQDPAHQRRFELNLAVLIRDEIDIVGCLRDARRAREAAERAVPYRREVADGEVQTPYAPVLVLPAAAAPAAGADQAALESFFAAQEVLAVFVTP
jgi:hypothetical protein